jgi:glutathione S-transferase
MRLFGNPISSNTRKVMWALKELRLSYEFINIDLMQGAHKSQDFLAINPNGRVPVLETASAGIISESNAILLYLSSQASPEHELFIGSDQKMAQVYQWTLWQASDLSSTILKPWLMKLYAKFGQTLDEVEHARLVEAAKAPLKVLNAHLEGRKYVAGSFSVADICLVEALSLCEDASISLVEFPAVAQYLSFLQSRPAFIETRPQF